MKQDDFIPSSIAYKLPRDAFKGLPATTQRRMLRLLAQVSEKSYRRGLQHGAVLGPEGHITRDVAELRHSPAMDKSPDADGGRVISAKERLKAEYGTVLRELGFDYDLLEGSNERADEKIQN
jgi:hypothetical protein